MQVFYRTLSVQIRNLILYFWVLRRKFTEKVIFYFRLIKQHSRFMCRECTPFYLGFSRYRRKARVLLLSVRTAHHIMSNSIFWICQKPVESTICAKNVQYSERDFLQCPDTSCKDLKRSTECRNQLLVCHLKA